MINVDCEQNGEEFFVNVCNVVFGSLCMNDLCVVFKCLLWILFYQFVEGQELHKSHADLFEWIVLVGFLIYCWQVFCVFVEDVFCVIDDFDCVCVSYLFEIDGVVIKVDDYCQ